MKLRRSRFAGAKKLTEEVMRHNPLLGALARQRIKQIEESRREADAQPCSKLSPVGPPKMLG